MPKTYRGDFISPKDNKPYMRYFQALPVYHEGVYTHEWHTSMDHDRGYYMLPSTWTIDEHEDGITITMLTDVGAKVVVAHLYDHEEEQRIAKELETKQMEALHAKTAAQIAKEDEDAKMADEQASAEEQEAMATLVVEISTNQEWLLASGVVIKISEISVLLAASINALISSPNDAEKTVVVMKTGNQITLDIPLEVLYRVLGHLPPK